MNHKIYKKLISLVVVLTLLLTNVTTISKVKAVDEVIYDGVTTGLKGDDIFTSVDIGFDFSFFGTSYSSAYITTNGLMSFDTGYTNCSNTGLSSMTKLIAPFWDDLIPSLSPYKDTIVYKTIGTAPNRQFITQWTNQYFWSTTVQLGTFQVILNETSNKIQIQYRTLMGSDRAYGNSATIGIVGEDSTEVYQYSYNETGAITEKQAISYTPDGDGYIANNSAAYDYIYLNNPLAPGVPVLESGALFNGAENVDPNVSVSWSSVERATSYRVYLATDANFTNLVKDQSTVDTTFNFTDLSNSTKYYLRVEAINSAGSNVSNPIYFTTASSVSSLGSVSTGNVSNIDYATASIEGDITNLGVPAPTQYGHVYNLTGNPTITDSKTQLGGIYSTGTYTSNLIGLAEKTRYYVRSYITNAEGTSYGDEISFMTLSPNTAPVVTSFISPLSSLKAKGEGTVNVSWNQATDIDTGDVITYHVDFYNGTSWISEVYTGTDNFFSYSVPSNLNIDTAKFRMKAVDASLAQSSTIESNSFLINSNKPVITLTGSLDITIKKGDSYIEYGFDAMDDLDGNITNQVLVTNSTNINEIGNYIVSYNVADSSLNQANQVSRTIHVIVPSLASVVTGNASNIDYTTASIGGDIINVGIPTPTQYGHVYNTTGNPTISDSKTQLGTINFTGDYTSNLVGLFERTRYYVRSYVTNSAGTSYGDEISFVTLSHNMAPVVTSFISPLSTLQTKGGSVVNVSWNQATDIDIGDVITYYVDFYNGTSWISEVYTGTDNFFSYSVPSNLNIDTAKFRMKAVDASLAQSSTIESNSFFINSNKPVITLTGSLDITIEKGDSYIEYGFDATDDLDGNITNQVLVTNSTNSNVIGDYTVRYNVTDSSLNQATQVSRTIHVIDLSIDRKIGDQLQDMNVSNIPAIKAIINEYDSLSSKQVVSTFKTIVRNLSKQQSKVADFNNVFVSISNEVVKDVIKKTSFSDTSLNEVQPILEQYIAISKDIKGNTEQMDQVVLDTTKEIVNAFSALNVAKTSTESTFSSTYTFSAEEFDKRATAIESLLQLLKDKKPSINVNEIPKTLTIKLLDINNTEKEIVRINSEMINRANDGQITMDFAGKYKQVVIPAGTFTEENDINIAFSQIKPTQVTAIDELVKINGFSGLLKAMEINFSNVGADGNEVIETLNQYVTTTIAVGRLDFEEANNLSVVYLADNGEVIPIVAKTTIIDNQVTITFNHRQSGVYAIVANNGTLVTNSNLSDTEKDDLNKIFNALAIDSSAKSDILDKEVTRKEVALTVYSLLNANLSPATSYFTDITNLKNNAIYSSLQANQLMIGYGDKTFRAENLITREELATILQRTSDYIINNSITESKSTMLDYRYEDESTISKFALDGANELGVIFKEDESQFFNPKGNVSSKEFYLYLKAYLSELGLL